MGSTAIWYVVISSAGGGFVYRQGGGTLILSNATFTAANSVDPDAGDTLTYAWDLDGDGQFDDATGATATTFMLATTTVSVKVTDSHGRSDIQSMLVTVSPAPDLIFANGFDPPAR